MISSISLNSTVKKIQIPEKYQFPSWKHNTFENIRDKLLEFVDFVPPFEKSGKVFNEIFH